MKYLKKFESISEIDKLQEFSENYLAYLLDEDFVIKVSNLTIPYTITKEYYKIEIRNKDTSFKTFKWNDIKDYIIPYLDKLSEDYTIENIIVYTKGLNNFIYSYNNYEKNIKELNNKKLQAILIKVTHKL